MGDVFTKNSKITKNDMWGMFLQKIRKISIDLKKQSEHSGLRLYTSRLVVFKFGSKIWAAFEKVFFLTSFKEVRLIVPQISLITCK